MMPRGEPTRAITIRVPEAMAVELEQRCEAAGKSLTAMIQEACLGTFRYPGRKYTWLESKEREKSLKQVQTWIERTLALRNERDKPCRLLGAIRETVAVTGGTISAETIAQIDAVLNV